MHRSEAEGRFGEAEPEGRASVCAEPTLRSVGVQDKMERASWECGAVNYPDAPPAPRISTSLLHTRVNSDKITRYGAIAP